MKLKHILLGLWSGEILTRKWQSLEITPRPSWELKRIKAIYFWETRRLVSLCRTKVWIHWHRFLSRGKRQGFRINLLSLRETEVKSLFTRRCKSGKKCLMGYTSKTRLLRVHNNLQSVIKLGITHSSISQNITRTISTISQLKTSMRTLQHSH